MVHQPDDAVEVFHAVWAADGQDCVGHAPPPSRGGSGPVTTTPNRCGALRTAGGRIVHLP